ncbi:MAG: branched-chain amino acid ABC transporter permease [Deltaproteobacteria bacterium]|nr:branched-chain amino acid ABC transporter permease [Deltaproteobacteria bacterium]
MLNLIINAIINGILLGGVYALLAIGLNLLFGVLKLIHLAYGQFVMIGLYILYVLVVNAGLPFWAAAIITIIVTGILGIIVHILIVQPLLDAPRLNQLLALAGLIIVFENLSMVIWGADYRNIQMSLPVVAVGGFYIRMSYLIAFIGGLITLGLLYLFLYKTYLGLSIRAISQDLEGVELMGVNPKVNFYVTMAAGGILTGIVAVFFAPIYAVHPHFGSSFTILAFIIVVLGGMGNLLGGFISAFIMGVVTSVAAFLTTSEIADIIAMLIFIGVMLVRPQGIMGIREAR